jgi:glycogen synthase
MPIKPGDLDYFKEIAGKCKGNLLVIAERMKKGYLELQLGSTFGLMPSIFEPFGAAIEYMVNGTLVIARNTGGLRDQITDGVDGLLYSESSPGTKSAEYNIENIRHYFQYRNNVKVPLAENNWAKEMVQSLKTKIEDAITIFNNPDQYFHMVLKGFEKAKEFSWDKSAEEYYEYYKKI